MRFQVIRRWVVVIAVTGTVFAVFNAVRAGETDETQETMDEVYESSVINESEELAETEESSVSEETSETVIIEQTEVLETSETSCSYECIESSWLLESEEIVESLETEESSEVEVEYDVPSSVIQGWYVPSFNYNADGTITYYLEDDTAFYTISTDGLELPSYAWAYTGLRGYVDYCYGSVNALSSEQSEALEAATDELLSGQEAQ